MPPKINSAPSPAAFPPLQPSSSTLAVLPILTPPWSPAFAPPASTSSVAPASCADFNYSIRRRSVDTGGLALSLRDDRSGKGWGGWEERETGGDMLFVCSPPPSAHSISLLTSPAYIYSYAELLTSMYTQTLNPSLSQPLPSLSTQARRNLIDILGTWSFDPHSLSEEQGFACVCLIFEAILSVDGMVEASGITMGIFPPVPIFPGISLLIQSVFLFRKTQAFLVCRPINIPPAKQVPQFPTRPRCSPGNIHVSSSRRLRAAHVLHPLLLNTKMDEKNQGGRWNKTLADELGHIRVVCRRNRT